MDFGLAGLERGLLGLTQYEERERENKRVCESRRERGHVGALGTAARVRQPAGAGQRLVDDGGLVGRTGREERKNERERKKGIERQRNGDGLGGVAVVDGCASDEVRSRHMTAELR